MNAVTLMQTNTGWYATNSGPWAACESKSGEKFAHWTTPDATAIAMISAETPRDVVIVVEGAVPQRCHARRDGQAPGGQADHREAGS